MFGWCAFASIGLSTCLLAIICLRQSLFEFGLVGWKWDFFRLVGRLVGRSVGWLTGSAVLISFVAVYLVFRSMVLPAARNENDDFDAAVVIVAAAAAAYDYVASIVTSNLFHSSGVVWFL